jgi:RNA polymerase primary sigma factor
MLKAIAKSNYRSFYFMRAPSHDMANRRELSRDEEYELASLIANGDRDARNRLVQANLGLVVTIASKFRGRGMDLDDLIGEGNLGLIRAAQDFDPSFAIRFHAYAKYWIKERILFALKNTASVIRVPSYMYRLLARWRRAQSMLCQQWGRTPTFQEVGTVLKLSPVQMSLVAHAHTAQRPTFMGDDNRGSTRQSIDDKCVCEGQREDRAELDEDLLIVQRRLERLDLNQA